MIRRHGPFAMLAHELVIDQRPQIVIAQGFDHVHFM